MDQHNTFRNEVERDNVIFGARASSFHPALVEIYGQLELDFVWLDFEHAGVSPWDSSVFENLTRAAEVNNIELLVRLPQGAPALIRKVLDAGVRNLLIPRINNAEEVREVVKAGRFRFEDGPGERGMAGWRSSAYGSKINENYPVTEDNNVCIGVMIEKSTAVTDLDRILDVPELGFVFIGPGDLSVQLGCPTEYDNPEVLDTVRQIETQARKYSVPLAGIGHNEESASELVDRGYQIVRIGGEFEAVRSTLARRLENITSTP